MALYNFTTTYHKYLNCKLEMTIIYYSKPFHLSIILKIGDNELEHMRYVSIYHVCICHFLLVSLNHFGIRIVFILLKLYCVYHNLYFHFVYYTFFL